MNDTNDELKPECDPTSMKVRRAGKGRMQQYVQPDDNGDLLPHYDFDYSKAKPNRFSEAYKKGVTNRLIRGDSDNPDESSASSRL